MKATPPRRSLILSVACVCALIGYAAMPPRAPGQTDRGFTLRVKSLTDSIRSHGTGHRLAAWSLELAERLKEAEHRGDAPAQLLLLRGLSLVLDDQGETARRLEVIAEALELAKRLGDRDASFELLYHRQVCLALLERLPESIQAGDELRVLADQAGSRKWRAVADTREGIARFFMGEPARAESLLLAAVPVLEAEDEGANHVNALQFLAIANATRGRSLEAKRLFEQALRRARGVGDREALASLLTNMCGFEFREGRFEQALGYLASLDSLTRGGGNARRLVWLHDRRASALIRLQRYEEAIAQADSGAELAARSGELPLQRGCVTLSAWALSNLGRFDESSRRLRAIVPPPGFARTDGAALTIVNALADNFLAMDSLDAAITLVRDHLAGADAAGPAEAAVLRLRLGDACLRSGRYDEAARAYAEGLRKHPAGSFNNSATALWIGRARAAQALGNREQSAECLRQAETAWHEARTRSGSSGFRERLASTGAELAGATLAALEPTATPEAIARAFETVERYKAQAFLERLTGVVPDSSKRLAVTLGRLQSEVLEPGELLLDLRLSESSSGVFAITREAIRWVPYPGRGRELARRVLEWRRLLASGSVSATGPGSPGVAIARDVLGAFVPELAAARRVIVAPELAFHLAPFRLLVAEAAFGGDPDRAPQVSVVPSATLLAEIRRAPERAMTGSFVASAAAEEPGDGGSLVGARSEVEWLVRRFAGVTRVSPKDSAGRGDWPSADVLHLAAHMRAEDGTPWNSAVRIRLDGPDGEPELRAERVALMKLPTRLVMLASCASVGEAVVAGEGVAGMAGAFLLAGARTVVATLWPVDDRMTEAFTRSFYEELEEGRSVGEAAAIAQRRLLARGAAPGSWAGYVVIGDPTTKVQLRARPRSSVPLAALALLAFVAVGVLMLRRRVPGAPA